MLQQPSNAKMVRSFVGMVNYYKTHLKDVSSIMAPLTSLLRKEACMRTQWNSLACLEAVKKVKILLVSLE